MLCSFLARTTGCTKTSMDITETELLGAPGLWARWRQNGSKSEEAVSMVGRGYMQPKETGIQIALKMENLNYPGI